MLNTWYGFPTKDGGFGRFGCFDKQLNGHLKLRVDARMNRLQDFHLQFFLLVQHRAVAHHIQNNFGTHDLHIAQPIGGHE